MPRGTNENCLRYRDYNNKRKANVSYCTLLLRTGRTMDLLNEGVKSLSRKLNESMDMNLVDILSPKASSSCKIKQERNSKQMVLNSKLELLRTDKAVKVSYSFVNSIRTVF